MNNSRNAPPEKSPIKRQYFQEINYLRGVAILFIVWSHFIAQIRNVGQGDWSSTWWVLDNFRETIVGGSSSLFAFISGFLFFHIFWKRGFSYYTFMKGKVLKVFLPWLLITIIFTTYRLARGHGCFFDSNFLYYGCFMYWSFWYVPFIMLMFLFSCFYLKFIEANTRTQLIVLLISTVFSMCLGRHNPNPFLSVLFWNALYLFGIFVGIHYERLKALDVTSKQCIIAGTFLLLASLASSGDWHYLKDWGTWHFRLNERVEWLMLGKMALCITLTGFFLWFKDHGWAWLKWVLNLLAKYSFSIFFLHQFALLWLERHPHKAFFAHFNFYGLHAVSFLTAIVVCILCILVAAPIQRLTGKYSRMVIGA